MIVANLREIAQQINLSPRMRRALDFLQQARGQELADGRLEIDGREVYALVQSYTSRAESDNPRWEAHQQYVDIQYVVSGVEAIGWASLDRLTVTHPYMAERDILLGTVAAEDKTLVRVAAGQAMVLYPSDAHAPQLAADAPTAVKKIVVKVLLDE